MAQADVAQAEAVESALRAARVEALRTVASEVARAKQEQVMALEAALEVALVEVVIEEVTMEVEESQEVALEAAMGAALVEIITEPDAVTMMTTPQKPSSDAFSCEPYTTTTSKTRQRFERACSDCFPWQE